MRALRAMPEFEAMQGFISLSGLIKRTGRTETDGETETSRQGVGEESAGRRIHFEPVAAGRVALECGNGTLVVRCKPYC